MDLEVFHGFPNWLFGGPQCSAKALLDEEHPLEVDPWFPQVLDCGSMDGCEILQHLVTPLGL